MALRNLLRNPRRTLAVILTVAIGTGSLFIYHGFNTGILRQYRENIIHARYGHGQINTKGYRDHIFEKPWEHWISDYRTLESQLSVLPEVKHIFPRVEFFGLMSNGRINVSGKGQGVKGELEAKFFNQLNIIEGKNLDQTPDGILLGKGLAHALNVHAGDRVTVISNTVHGSMNAGDFTVSGVFHTGVKEFDDVYFRIQIEQAHQLLDTQKIESIAIGLKSFEAWGDFQKIIENKFPNLEATAFAVLDKVNYQHSVDWLNSQFAVTQLIILAIVILGIFNTISISILERKQEIGNLRANGESLSEVMVLLGTEGLALGICGAVLGIMGALAFNSLFLEKGILMPPAPGITKQEYVLIQFQPLMAGLVFVLGTFCVVLGTVCASYKIIRMPIAEALRSV